MSFFQPPSRTPYDLNFRIFGFPVQVHPLFWLIALLLGIRSGDVSLLLIWVVVLFISILIHELGHSLMMRAYGVDSYIVLHMFGGLAVPRSQRGGLTPLKQVLISLAGPFAGFLFAGLTLAVAAAMGGFISINLFLGFIPLPTVFLFEQGLIVNALISTILWINIFWGLINLLPVFPLDGGHVSRHILVKLDPWNGVRKALWLSVLTGGIIAITGFVVFNSIYMGFLFGILAFQSYQMVQGGSIF